MKNIYLLAALLVLSTSALFAVEYNITVDGQFDDWADVQAAYSKTPTGNGTEILAIKTVTDSRFIFVYFELSKEIVLNNYDVSFFFDADLNAQSGEGSFGADLTWDFANLKGSHIVQGEKTIINHSHLNLVGLPSYSSNKFEFAIERKVAIKGKVLFPEVSTRFWMTTGSDQAPGDAPLTIQLDGERIFSAPVTIERAVNSDLRVATFNARMDNIFTPAGDAAFGKLISALRPDVIALQEIYDHTAQQTLVLVSKYYPSMSPLSLYSLKAEPDIVLISRYPIIDIENIAGNGVFHLSSKNALGTNLIVIASHLPAGDKDSERAEEADKLVKAISEINSGNFKFNVEKNAPIIMLGDFNLVGSSAQYRTLVDGKLSTGETLPPDAGVGSFAQAQPVQPFVPMTYTWRNAASDYPASHLDYIFYTSSTLELKNSLALFTEELPSEYLTQYGLDYSASSDASDHLPFVADFSIKTLSVREEDKIADAYPNPAYDFVMLPAGASGTVKVFRSTGELIFERECDPARIDVRALPPGLYLMQAEADGESRFYKFVKL